MKRRTTFLLAGFLTAGVITGIVSVANNASASSAGPTLGTTPAVIETATEKSATVDLAVVYQERETALQARVVEGETAIKTLDETMQPQINDLNAEIQIVASRAAEKAQLAVTLQDSVAQLQAQIEQEGQAFQQQVAALQERDSQARSQLDTATGQLQAAYDQLATQQASMASSSGSSNGGDSSTNTPSSHDDGENGDQGHQDGKHDEGHESHEDEHDDD